MKETEVQIHHVTHSDGYVSYEELLFDIHLLKNQGASDFHLNRYGKNVDFLNRLLAFRTFKEISSKEVSLNET
jgi:hypothetical protein